MSRKLTESKKKMVAGKQFYKCANKPGLKLIGLDGYDCPLWCKPDENKGSFDISGYDVDHIIEHSLTEDDSIENLQALCLSCHKVKTKKFLSKSKKLIAKEKESELNKSLIDLTLAEKELTATITNTNTFIRQLTDSKIDLDKIS